MKTHDEIEQELEGLFQNDAWDEHPTYPLEDWKYEVGNDDTRQGYRGWLYNKIANEEEEETKHQSYKRPHVGEIWYCPRCGHEWLAFDWETRSECPKCGTKVEEG